MIPENGITYHIESAEGTDGLVDQRHDFLLFGDIASDSDGALPGLLDPLYEGIKLLAFRGQIADHHVQTILGKAESDSFPDALCCASNNRSALDGRHLVEVGLRDWGLRKGILCAAVFCMCWGIQITFSVIKDAITRRTSPEMTLMSVF